MYRPNQANRRSRPDRQVRAALLGEPLLPSRRAAAMYRHRRTVVAARTAKSVSPNQANR